MSQSRGSLWLRWTTGILFVASSGFALAQPRPGPGPGPWRRPGFPGRPGPTAFPGAVDHRMALHPIDVALDHADDLKLSDEAIVRLVHLRGQIRKEADAKRGMLMEARRAFLMGVHGPKAEAARVETLAKKVGDALTALLLVPLKAREGVDQILTPEQRKKLETFQQPPPRMGPMGEEPGPGEEE